MQSCLQCLLEFSFSSTQWSDTWTLSDSVDDWRWNGWGSTYIAKNDEGDCSPSCTSAWDCSTMIAKFNTEKCMFMVLHAWSARFNSYILDPHSCVFHFSASRMPLVSGFITQLSFSSFYFTVCQRPLRSRFDRLEGQVSRQGATKVTSDLHTHARTCVPDWFRKTPIKLTLQKDENKNGRRCKHKLGQTDRQA